MKASMKSFSNAFRKAFLIIYFFLFQQPSEASDTKIKLYGMGNEPPSPGEANSAEEEDENEKPKRKKNGH